MGSRIKLLVSDLIMSMMWVCSSVVIKALVYNVLGFGLDAKGEVFKCGISILNMFFFAWLSKTTKGGSYNPLTVLSPLFSADFNTFLFTVGARIPAQVIGTIAGVRLILDTFPEIGRGPRLNGDINNGALTEGFLTFAIVFVSLVLTVKLPGSYIMRKWISSLSILPLYILGSDLTYQWANPASAMEWAYARDDHTPTEHAFVFLAAPLEPILWLVWMCISMFRFKKEEKAKVKAGKSD